MQEHPTISPYRLQKESARLKEDAELEFRLQKLDLQITEAEPTTKTLTCSGNYADFLIAKKLAEKKGWALERAV